MGIATDNCPFFFFVAFTRVAESVAFTADAGVVKLSLAVLSELSVPLQAIMPKIMDMITLPCMSLLVVVCFILAFKLRNMYCIGQKPGLGTIQPLEAALSHTGRQSYGRSVDIGS